MRGVPQEQSRKNSMQVAGELEKASTLRLHIKKEEGTWKPGLVVGDKRNKQ
jgi:hypothetical protein